MASFVTNRARYEFANGNIDWINDTIKMALVGTSFDGTVDDDFIGDITTLNELSGTGYVAGFGNSGRHTLTINSGDVFQDETNDRAALRAVSPETWSSIDAGTVHAGIVMKEITDDAASIFIAKIELSTNRVTNGGDFNFEFANTANGDGDVIHFTT